MLMKIKGVFLFNLSAAMFLAVSLVCGDSLDDSVGATLDAYMTALSSAGRFDGAVLVARGDEVLLSKGYGTACYEFSVPVTPETVFPIGSNTKQFTAAAVMLLQEQGLLNLDDPVSIYVPSAPPEWDDIRIHHLLNHTSGIPSEGAYDSSDPENIRLADIVERITELPLEFQAGTDMTYSNNGYITLSYIVEQASGMDYVEYLDTSFFQPLGMTDTWHDNTREVFPGRASGYTTFDGKHVHYEMQNSHNRYGAGCLHSTTGDLYRWMKALHSPGTILSEDSHAAIMNNDYGLVRGELNGRTVIGHGGRAVGFISYTLYYPAQEVAIIFLSNNDRTPMAVLPRDLSSIVFGEVCAMPHPLDRLDSSLSEEELQEYTGTYSLEWESNWIFDVFTEGNRLLYTSTFPRETVELFHEEADTFFVTPESNDSFIFNRDDDGNVSGFELFTLGGDFDRAVRLEE